MYFLLILSVVAASFNSIVLNKSGANNKNCIFKFNFLCSLVWCIILFLTNNCNLHINQQILFWGALYGIAQSCFLIFKTAAMSTGSVAVTTLVGNSSLLISTFASLVIWKESVTLTDILGLALLCLSIFLCIYEKSEKRYSSKWKYYAFFFFIFAASVGLIYKGFGKAGNIEYCGDMMLFSSIIMTLINLIISFGIKEKYRLNKSVVSNTKRFLLFALGSGLLSCLYNRLNIELAGDIDGIIFFPCFNGGVVILSALFSFIFLKEKLSLYQKTGICIGVISICIIGIL